MDNYHDIEKFLPPKSELEKADDEVSIIVLIRGRKSEGGPFYAYVAIPPSKIIEFKKAEAMGSYIIEDYGDIIMSGDASGPPPEVVKEMQEKYGIDPDFEENIQKSLEKQLAEEGKKPKEQDLLKKIKELKDKKED